MMEQGAVIGNGKYNRHPQLHHGRHGIRQLKKHSKRRRSSHIILANGTTRVGTIKKNGT
jgi:hypothetical protein